MCHVMGICMKIVNSVRRSLQRRILRAQLEENESDYGEFLHHGDVLMSRRKQRSAFDQVSEFDRGKIVAYRDCGLSFREIGSRVGRNQTTVMRICDR
ncbi:uncharacterized protein TNCV_4753261 [Trichonephila clavipes]|nr:uncharacterized protein TNCV_4753261 [Trichonephila clavipes]